MINHTLIHKTCQEIKDTLEEVLIDLHVKDMRLKGHIYHSGTIMTNWVQSDSETDYSDDDETDYETDSETDYSEDDDSMSSYIHKLSKYYKYNTNPCDPCDPCDLV